MENLELTLKEGNRNMSNLNNPLLSSSLLHTPPLIGVRKEDIGYSNTPPHTLDTPLNGKGHGHTPCPLTRRVRRARTRVEARCAQECYGYKVRNRRNRGKTAIFELLNRSTERTHTVTHPPTVLPCVCNLLKS